MKRAFTTNWYIYRICVPETNQTTIQCEVDAVPTPEETSSCHHCFEDLLLEAVDEEFSLLGELVKLAVYHNLKKTFKIDRKAIPYRIDEFAKGIERMFGEGARLLEIQIIKRLYAKLDRNIEYSPQSTELMFVEYVVAAKSSKHR